MNVSYATLLRKMEQELHQAKQSGQLQSIRQHVQAIKALCELVLEEQEEAQAAMIETAQSKVKTISSTTIQPPSLSSQVLTTDDGANGESIFDF
ncbi:MAG: YwdI family protein [Bacillus sp. (in: Bacteria)]|nr:YwdI family protein [Bacillus sp. (in: firmicutes)]